MKAYILATILLAGASIPVQSSTILDRAESFLSQSVPEAALDNLALLDISSLSASDRQKAIYTQGLAHFRRGDYAAAYQSFATLLNESPSSRLAAAAHIGEGDCLFAQSRFGAAYEAYAAVDTEALNASEAALLNFREGVCAYRQGNIAPAKSLLKAAARDKSQSSAANYYLAIIAYDEGDYDTAKRHFSLVSPSSVPGQRTGYYMALIDFRQQAWAKALSEAKGQLTVHNDNFDRSEMLRVAGESLIRMGNKSEGIEYTRRYLGASKSPALSALYLVGLDDYEHGEYRRALEHLEPVTKSQDRLLAQSAYLYIGQALMHTGDRDAAIVAFGKAIDYEDADPQAREAAYYNYVIARLSGASIPFVSSAKILDEFLRAYPDGVYSQRVAAYLADGYLADKDYSRALDYINKVKRPSRELQATRKRALYELARQALSDNNPKEAKQYLSQLATTEGSPKGNDSEIILLKAQAENYDGNPEEAVALYRRYLQQAPQSADNRHIATYGLGYAYYKLRQLPEAEKQFSAALTAARGTAMRSDILSRLADIAFAQSDFSKAADYYSEAYHAGGNSADKALFDRARMEGFMRDYNAKIASLNTFRGEFSSSHLMPEALLETAQAQISLGRNQEATDTYKSLIEQYRGTSAERKAFLQLAMTQRDMGKNNEAVATYKNLITQYPTSEEARQAAGILKNIYIDAGQADDFLAFMQTVSSAPQIDAGEAERMSFDSARKNYRSGGNTAPLKRFIDRYPASAHVPDALALLLKDARGKANKEEADAIAKRILSDFPHHSAAENARAQQASSLYASGAIPEALEQWRKLAELSSNPAMLAEAHLGAMRAARDMGDDETTIAEANAVIAHSTNQTEINEATFTKAAALEASGSAVEAIDIWQNLASNTSDIFGAKSAYRAAEALFENGREEKAIAQARALTQSGSQHSYWVARAFILLSDIYRKQGKDFEADEYLKVLRENYPGKENDIFMMIDSRLAKE